MTRLVPASIFNELRNDPFLVGFDQIFDRLVSTGTASAQAPSSPPYNIVKKENGVYEITLAAAGFQKDDISISLEKGTLTIKGELTRADDQIEYLYKGIAERNFMRSFKLAEYVEVENAEFKDGILRVSLIRNIPAEQMPQQIQIA